MSGQASGVFHRDRRFAVFAMSDMRIAPAAPPFPGASHDQSDFWASEQEPYELLATELGQLLGERLDDWERQGITFRTLADCPSYVTIERHVPPTVLTVRLAPVLELAPERLGELEDLIASVLEPPPPSLAGSGSKSGQGPARSDSRIQVRFSLDVHTAMGSDPGQGDPHDQSASGSLERSYYEYAASYVAAELVALLDTFEQRDGVRWLPVAQHKANCITIEQKTPNGQLRVELAPESELSDDQTRALRQRLEEIGI